MAQILKMPVFGPLTPAFYPIVDKYDPTPTEPADWKLKISLKSSQLIQLQPICDGTLSTVPPHEVLGPEFITVGLENAERPTRARYYLEPDPLILQILGENLKNTRLGDSVKWFVYEFVDTHNSLASAIEGKFSGEILRLHWNNSHDLSPDYADEAFLLGQLKVDVKKEDIIGTAPLEADNMYHIKFGVFTSNGYVDPVYFFNTLQSLVEGDEESDSSALNTLVGTDWPFAAKDGNVNTLISEAEQKLYPNAVLQEARQRLIWVSEDQQWREIANAQKAQYLERLYNRATGSEPPFLSVPPFQFNTEEMINPYQLEAIVEFFIFWKDPGVSDNPPLIEDFTALQDVNFSGGDDIDDIQLVLIDAFNDARLGSPTLPKPDWAIDPWEQEGNMCDPYGPLSPYPKDEYNGVLFLLYKGQIKGWYRWNSYSSHRWEDDSQGSCNYASSIQGNLKYKFWSRTSPNSKTINHGLCAWYDGNDSEILAMRPSKDDPEKWVPAKFYSRGGTPADSDGKTEAIFHFGLTKHDLATDRAVKTDHQYNGSGGCIPAPSYYLFRWDLCHWYFQQNPSLDEEKRKLLEKIKDAKNHALAVKLWGSAEKEALSDAWGSDDTKANGYTIHGTFWLIRPDEPTQK